MDHLRLAHAETHINRTQAYNIITLILNRCSVTIDGGSDAGALCENYIGEVRNTVFKYADAFVSRKTCLAFVVHAESVLAQQVINHPCSDSFNVTARAFVAVIAILSETV